MKNLTKDKFDSMTRTQQQAYIFRKKTGSKGSIPRLRLEGYAARYDHCREIHVDPETKEETKGKRCKTPLCPTCEPRKAKTNFRVLYDQFEEYLGSGRLRQIRMDLDCGNVRGKKKLLRVLKALRSAWQILTRSSVWKAVVVKAGAIIHLPWKESTSDHDAGLWCHLHAVVLTRTASPRFLPLLDEYRRILRRIAVSSGGREREVISVHDANHLNAVAGYLTHIRKRIIGYPEKKGAPWLLWEIRDEDITAYIDATKNKLRILQRGFDPDILRISRRRRQRLPPGVVEPQVEPSKEEMASIYMRLSMQNHDHLTIRFEKLARFITEKCEPEKRCRLRACSRCLQHHLDYESGLITGRRAHPKEDLVSSLLLRVPGLVDSDHLESSAASLYFTIGKFLRKSKAWPQEPSAFVFRLRARPVRLRGGRTSFRLSVRLLMAFTGELDRAKLTTRWKRQLRAAGLKCRPERGKPIVVIRKLKDLDPVVAKLGGLVKTILGPIASMNPEEASAYLHVLAMRSDLFVSDDWEQS